MYAKIARDYYSRCSRDMILSGTVIAIDRYVVEIYRVSHV